jgi:hypothetical protein
MLYIIIEKTKVLGLSGDRIDNFVLTHNTPYVRTKPQLYVWRINLFRALNGLFSFEHLPFRIH